MVGQGGEDYKHFSLLPFFIRLSFLGRRKGGGGGGLKYFGAIADYVMTCRYLKYSSVISGLQCCMCVGHASKNQKVKNLVIKNLRMYLM